MFDMHLYLYCINNVCVLANINMIPTTKKGEKKHKAYLPQPMDNQNKSLNFIFPTKYVIPKSLKFSHWPSKLLWWLIFDTAHGFWKQLGASSREKGHFFRKLPATGTKTPLNHSHIIHGRYIYPHEWLIFIGKCR